jgi:hypothetical protein
MPRVSPDSPLAATLLLTLLSAPAPSPGNDLVISEFMASNETTLIDADGAYSDWIEIYNAGAAAVNLDGWFLTDRADWLDQWRFPAVTLQPGGFLLVFASGKDRRLPGAELHTSFKLSADPPEYLGLIAPGGVMVVHEFGLTYPPQVEDISYGLSQNATLDLLVATGAPARTLIPSSDALARTWTQVGFDDSTWISGTTGVGYDRNPDYLSLIGTNVRSQMDNVNATAYIRIPFTVTDPARFNGLFLRMKYDDGFIAYLNGTQVTSRNAPSNPTWNSVATGQHDDAAAVVFEEYDISGSVGLLRAGQNVLAIHGLNASLGSSDFLILPELEAFGSGSLDRNRKEFFTRPTPRLGNLPGYPGVAAKPQFSRASGMFSASFSLSLSSSTPGAVIRYTLNGPEPTASSTAYSAPLTIQSTTMVRARAFASTLAPSPVVTQTFVRLASNVSNVTSNLPILVIETFGQGINDSFQTTGFAAMMEPGAGGRTSITSAPATSTRVGIKLRGSSSLGFPKKNYALESWDERNNDLAVSFLGFPEEPDWILHGPYSDKTLMRNQLSYLWSNRIGRYAVGTRFVEMYLNTGSGNLDSSDYAGVYVFMEKIKRDSNRVDIKKMHAGITSAPDLSGGYILKKDRLDPGDSGFFTSRGQRLAYVHPKEQYITPAQRAWIKGYLDEFETVLYGSNYRHPQNGYAKYIDVDSFIDHHILVEITKNIDGFRLSTFMYKDREGKLNMGPIWDYNLSLGNANYLQGWVPQGWYYPQLSEGDYPWYGRLFQDIDFVQRYIDRWTALRRVLFTTDSLLSDIDQSVAMLNESQVRNFQRWPTLGTYVWPNQFIGNTYLEEINFMKGWLRDRVAWWDSNYVPAPLLNQNGGPISPGFELHMSAARGTVYYTLDGLDPRLPAGAIAPAATAYTSPVVLGANARVFARARVSNTSWSGLTDATFVVATPALVISEIMYNPWEPPAGSSFSAQDFEFIELLNVGSEPLNLAGFRFSLGISFTFGAGAGMLGPDEYVVLVKNLDAFRLRYDTVGVRIGGVYEGNLSNAGELLSLEGPLNEPILRFTYSDDWHPATDGEGHSLVILDPYGPLSNWERPESWRASRELGGSPGRSDDEGPGPGGLQLPGDSNQDGQIDISDAISFLRRLFTGGSMPLPCEGSSLNDGGNLVLLDTNGDSRVDLSDAVHVLNFLFKNGPPPARAATCVRIVGCPHACRQ